MIRTEKSPLDCRFQKRGRFLTRTGCTHTVEYAQTQHSSDNTRAFTLYWCARAVGSGSSLGLSPVGSVLHGRSIEHTQQAGCCKLFLKSFLKPSWGFPWPFHLGTFFDGSPARKGLQENQTATLKCSASLYRPRTESPDGRA